MGRRLGHAGRTIARRRTVDAIDARILELLQADGRMPYAELGSRVGISGPAVHERVRKLEARGVIAGYAAVVDPAALGYHAVAFVRVTRASGTSERDLDGVFATMPEVEECHHIAGDADYLLKLRARDTADLERILRRVQSTPEVNRTETDVVFSTTFERRRMPVMPDRETAAQRAT